MVGVIIWLNGPESSVAIASVARTDAAKGLDVSGLLVVGLIPWFGRVGLLCVDGDGVGVGSEQSGTVGAASVLFGADV
jgi:hypothetical protein